MPAGQQGSRVARVRGGGCLRVHEGDIPTTHSLPGSSENNRSWTGVNGEVFFHGQVCCIDFAAHYWQQHWGSCLWLLLLWFTTGSNWAFLGFSGPSSKGSCRGMCSAEQLLWAMTVGPSHLCFWWETELKEVPEGLWARDVSYHPDNLSCKRGKACSGIKKKQPHEQKLFSNEVKSTQILKVKKVSSITTDLVVLGGEYDQKKHFKTFSVRTVRGKT